MDATKLSDFLKKTGMSVTDIAAAVQVHPQTIYRFLNGGRVHRTTLAAIDLFVASKSYKPEAKAATG